MKQSDNLAQQMYGLTGRTMAQRVTLAILLGFWTAAACWLLCGGGLAIAGSWLGRTWHAESAARCGALAAAFCIYYARVLCTTFVFLQRGISWQETFTIAPWVLLLFLLFGIAGGLNPARMGWAEAAGALLFLLGSWTNSWAEYRRRAWKKRPENKGHLYTQSLFHIARHPNYLGDLVSFSGLCLLAGRWFTWIVPLLMLLGFVFVNIPILDAHLRTHYGAEFDAYAKKTRKLIPFVY